MKKKQTYWQNLAILACMLLGWIGFSLVFYFSIPVSRTNPKNLFSFARFYVLLLVYCIFVLALFCHKKCLYHPFFCVWKGLAFIVISLIFLKVSTSSLPSSFSSRLPNFFWLGCFLFTYWLALIGTMRCLATIFPSFAPFFLFLLGMATLGNLFYSEILLYIPPCSLSHSHVTFFLYTNPMVVAISSFPQYDYLRNSAFYVHSPLATCFPGFRYPEIGKACCYYGAFGLFFWILQYCIVCRQKKQCKEYR